MRSQLHRKTVRRRLQVAAIISVNAVLLGAVLLFVLNGRSNGDMAASLVSGQLPQHAQAAVNPLDQISSADIARNVSVVAGMPEKTAITNQATTADVNMTAATTSSSVAYKPEVITTTFKSNKDIQTYVVQSGDTVSSIAAKFSVTSDSVRWSNSLSGEAVNAGTKLLIPPVGYPGIVYTVKAGDTLDSVASKYKADKDELTRANDAEIAGLSVGERIIIPNGQQPVAAPTYSYRAATATASTGYAFGSSAIYGYNGYDYGYCTWYVANRRIQAGRPLPANLGNASSWGYIARSAGLPTGNTPQPGAAAVSSTVGEGHVVYVESVNADGSILISEMNYQGWDVVDQRTIPAAEAARYTYIY